MSTRTFFQAMTVFAGVAATASTAQASPSMPDELSYSVVREGDEIGTHQISFRESADGLNVNIETDVAVEVFGIAFYRFEHSGHEIWQGERLISLVSETNDDGIAHALNAVAEGRELRIESDARRGLEGGGIIPASLWNRDLVRQSELLNTLDGSTMAVDVADLGEETVVAAGRQIEATHYSVTGKLNRELWYNSDDVLVQVKFDGADGSEVTYVLK
jgi:uncharacterized protein DUF6134